ncbi:hypothetical protein ACFV1L_05945 [Kitasatospora sp. NPDC059646]|uniref:hypothetical protein n=1 Tax=Kitasatospora sp. NPDC059646 TaxID=3346893 RepID=UPI0036C0F961
MESRRALRRGDRIRQRPNGPVGECMDVRGSLVFWRSLTGGVEREIPLDQVELLVNAA